MTDPTTDAEVEQKCEHPSVTADPSDRNRGKCDVCGQAMRRQSRWSYAGQLPRAHLLANTEEGKECTCFARSSGECACGAWDNLEDPHQ